MTSMQTQYIFSRTSMARFEFEKPERSSIAACSISYERGYPLVLILRLGGSIIFRMAWTMIAARNP